MFFGAGFKVALNDMQKNHIVIISNEIVISLNFSGNGKNCISFSQEKNIKIAMT